MDPIIYLDRDSGTTYRVYSLIVLQIGWVIGSATYSGLKTGRAKRVKPLLSMDGDGVYRLQSSSPACSKFIGTPFNSLMTVDPTLRLAARIQM